LLNVIVLAAASAVSPTILAVVIVVLRRPRPQGLLLAYLGGRHADQHRAGASTESPARPATHGQSEYSAELNWMSRHARQIVIAIAGLAGVYLMARGVAGVA
jgi:hypothetical protein